MVLAPIKWLILSLQFATIVPSPSIKRVTDNDIQNSALFFPIIGLLLGLSMWFIQLELWRHMSPMAASVVSLTAYTLVTGALHVDGLMDTADAIGSRRPRDIALEIMKDSRVGAMGVVIAILVMAGKLAAMSSLSPRDAAPYLVVPMVSRLGMVWSMVIAPSARSNGLGALFAKKVPIWVALCATSVVVVICCCLVSAAECLWTGVYFVAVTVGFTSWMVRKFGGATGDTYGALNEFLEWVGWLVFAVRSF